jgi:tRNA G18 (ribose-2'-O)-methylase SpoU
VPFCGLWRPNRREGAPGLGRSGVPRPARRFDEAPRPRAALVTHGASPLSDAVLPDRVTFVLGAERAGLPDDIAADCEQQTTIPLAPAAESLNVAVTAAIALYEWSRRRP